MKSITKKILFSLFVFVILISSAQAITVQRGSTSITTSALNITVDEFTPENTFILLSTRSSSGSPDSLLVAPKVLNETTFELRRYGTDTAQVHWELINWDETSVQEDVVSFGTSDTIVTTDISPVVLNESFIIVYSRLDSGTNSQLIRGQFAGRFFNESRIEFTRLVDGTAGEIYWQVVSINNATIQDGSFTLTGTSSTQSITAVNMSQSLLLFSRSADNTGLARYSVQGQIISETTVRFDRTNSADEVYIDYFVIEHPRFLVQRGQTSVSGGSPVTQSITTVDNLSRTFMYATWDSGGTGTANGNAFVTHYLSSDDQITFQKGTTSQTNVQEWQVIQVLEPPVELPPGIALFSCQFRESTTCEPDEVLVLRAGNDTGGFNNAHVQHKNQTAIYTNSLCCEADENYNLSATCEDDQTIEIARIFSLHDSHIQIPPNDNYNYPICLGSSFGNFTCEYVNGTCSDGFTGVFSMASSEENAGQFNATNAHIAEPGHYELNVCCQIGRAPPLTPELLSPADGNDTVFERNVTLEWTVPFEPDGDDIFYDLQLNVTAGSCSVEHEEFNLEQNNFTTNELCVDQLYMWSVRACDIDGCSDWAEPFNFTIASTLGISFINNQTTFASLVPGQTNDTQAGPGQPLHIENTGNIVSDIELNATAPLFNNAGLDTEFFQFLVAESIPDSFVSATSAYTNVSSSMITIINSLSYAQTMRNDAFIHLRVTVPENEVPGPRSTTLTARVSAS